ncbi:ribosome hibernation-promoting factor, HPF/YfiA family [Serpentinicella alkaliphila]|uniref:Ribosome hibernation promoting factor n=1 Tax=Serpentinicella alkaliphila TaxID=1734049 RepID=A0A4R2THS3_9FIRM|nr:ribosome-associated translation inhibitor RaiA [Serpentinicella alkaliphila]QUH24906.1 ribosome-associated translation inhibitor RaiA [Serpentinicella alkaliphila]TCQ01817.1 putative sigma-54 modulation protein [Serpentinicella alkaliphila]
MNIMISGKNVEVTDALRDAVESKVSKLTKYFSKGAEVKATLSVEKNRQIIEVTIPINGSVLRAEEATEDMYMSIDKVVDKLIRQLRKHKTKLENRLVKYETIRFENIPAFEEVRDDADAKIVKTKRFAIKPMSSEEAVLQMELVGHNFFVFANAITDEVNVVYKRKDGNYGLIEPEF